MAPRGHWLDHRASASRQVAGSAQATRTPGETAAGTTSAGGASNDPAAAEPKPYPAATKSDPDPASAEPAAAPAPGTPSAAATASATTATTAAAAATTTAGELYAAAEIFLVEKIERGEADVGHFLFAKDEALIGQGIVGSRDIASWRRRCGYATRQRKTQPGTQHSDGSSFACALLCRSLLDPWHGRILQKLL